ncbi:MAG: GYD domain-containing protein [Kiloniellales bacterium]
MKYVLLGSLSADWAKKHPKRVESAKAKLKELGIKLEAVYYTQGQFDFVDVVETPDPEALLSFSVWYTTQGYGRIQSMPAFDADTLARAADKA